MLYYRLSSKKSFYLKEESLGEAILKRSLIYFGIDNLRLFQCHFELRLVGEERLHAVTLSYHLYA